jgi:hypothetical protein
MINPAGISVGALSSSIMDLRVLLATRVPAVLLGTVALGTAALVLTGCGAAPSTPVAAPTPSYPMYSCSVVPATTVGSVLGQMVKDPKQTSNPPATVCTYLPSSAKGYAVVLRLQGAVTPAIFAAEQAGAAGMNPDTVAYPGLVDEAYANTLTAAGTTTHTLAARKGTVEVAITTTATLDQAKALVQTVFEEL